MKIQPLILPKLLAWGEGAGTTATILMVSIRNKDRFILRPSAGRDDAPIAKVIFETIKMVPRMTHWYPNLR